MSAEPKFLIVDDFATMRRIVRNLLKELGHQNADEAENGQDALKKLRGSKFDFLAAIRAFLPNATLQKDRPAADSHIAAPGFSMDCKA